MIATHHWKLYTSRRTIGDWALIPIMFESALRTLVDVKEAMVRLIVRPILTDPIVPFAIMATGVPLELKGASPVLIAPSL